MQIGHRVATAARGGAVGRKYWIQYCIDGKHHYEPTGSTNKAVAIRRAHEVAQRLARGEQRRVAPKHTLADVVQKYLDRQVEIPLLSLEEARQRRFVIDWSANGRPARPEFTGTRVLTDFPLGGPVDGPPAAGNNEDAQHRNHC